MFGSGTHDGAMLVLKAVRFCGNEVGVPNAPWGKNENFRRSKSVAIDDLCRNESQAKYRDSNNPRSTSLFGCHKLVLPEIYHGAGQAPMLPLAEVAIRLYAAYL